MRDHTIVKKENKRDVPMRLCSCENYLEVSMWEYIIVYLCTLTHSHDQCNSTHVLIVNVTKTHTHTSNASTTNTEKEE